jgi:2-polyprenyl-3-methyl-5-hydroxy-6-metoxy-1,4-benzoquinol methylase
MTGVTTEPLTDPPAAASPDGAASSTGRQSHAIARSRRWWEGRAALWETQGSAGLGAVVAAVIEEAAAVPGAVVVDLGCGTGELSLPLAAAGAEVTAVDVSTAMIERLRAKAAAAGVAVSALVQPIEVLSFEPGSVDVVVSNYAFHHLRDADKAAAVKAAARWLRPGGRLVVGDMMFGRGATARDRRIIAGKVASMLRRGPAGWYRLAKNVLRFSVRTQERPVPVETWQRYFAEAGFADVSVRTVVAEAAVVRGTKP